MNLLILRIALLAPHEGAAQFDQNTRQIKAVFAADGGPPSTHLFRKRLPKGTSEGARGCLHEQGRALMVRSTRRNTAVEGLHAIQPVGHPNAHSWDSRLTQPSS